MNNLLKSIFLISLFIFSVNNAQAEAVEHEMNFSNIESLSLWCINADIFINTDVEKLGEIKLKFCYHNHIPDYLNKIDVEAKDTRLRLGVKPEYENVPMAGERPLLFISMPRFTYLHMVAMQGSCSLDNLESGLWLFAGGSAKIYAQNIFGGNTRLGIYNSAAFKAKSISGNRFKVASDSDFKIHIEKLNFKTIMTEMGGSSCLEAEEVNVAEFNSYTYNDSKTKLMTLVAGNALFHMEDSSVVNILKPVDIDNALMIEGRNKSSLTYRGHVKNVFSSLVDDAVCHAEIMDDNNNQIDPKVLEKMRADEVAVIQKVFKENFSKIDNDKNEYDEVEDFLMALAEAQVASIITATDKLKNSGDLFDSRAEYKAFIQKHIKAVLDKARGFIVGVFNDKFSAFNNVDLDEVADKMAADADILETVKKELGFIKLNDKMYTALIARVIQGCLDGDL